MEIRRATARDATDIALLEQDIFPDAWDEKSVCRVICAAHAMCFCATEGERVIAYLLGVLIPPEGEIYRLAVTPGKRRRGIGYRLLDYAAKTERGRGLETLFLEVRRGNIPARNLYKSYGFREMEIRRDYYRDVGADGQVHREDAIVMLRSHERTDF